MAALFDLNSFRAQHDAWEIKVPNMRRSIGAMVIAKLALIAQVNHFLIVVGLENRSVLTRSINALEHEVKRRAEVKTPPALMTYVENPGKFLVQVTAIPEKRGPDIKSWLSLKA